MFKNYFKLLVFLGVFVGSWLGSLDISAQTKYWIGVSGSNWGTASNWSPSGVPNSSSVVFVTINATIKVNAAAEAASLTMTQPNAKIDIADGQELTLGTKLLVASSNPFGAPSGSDKVGLLVCKPASSIAPGGFEIQHTGAGNQFVTIPRIASIGDVGIEFVTGTSGYISGDGSDRTNIFISADGKGIFLNNINDKLYVNAGGGLDFETSATLGGVNPSNPAEVHFVTGSGFTTAADFELNEVSGLAFGTVTIQGSLYLGDANTHVDIDPVDADASQVNILRIVNDLIVGTKNDGTPFTNGAGVHGVVAFANVSSKDITVSGAPFLTVGAMLVDLSGDKQLTLNSSITIDGTPTGFTTVFQILNGGDVNVSAGKSLFISADPARNDIFATANGTSAVQGRVIGGGFTSVSRTVQMSSDFAIATDLEINQGAYVDMNGQADTDNFNLYLAGSTINLKESPFLTSSASYIQFYGDKFQTVTHFISSNVLLPQLQVAKGKSNKAHVTFATTGPAKGDYLIGGANSDNVSLLFTSVDLDGTDVKGNLSQVVISKDLALGFGTALGTGIAGIFDQTDGNGDVSGKGTAFLSTNTFLSVADPSKVDAFDMGANFNVNGQSVDLRGALGLDLGGAFIGNGFITTDGTSNNQQITFVSIAPGANSIENMADAFATANRTVFTDVLDFSTIPNLVLQRDVALARALTVSADDAGTNSKILTFDGGSFFATAKNSGNSVFISANGQNQEIVQTAKLGGFNNIEFLTVNYSSGASIDVNKETDGDFRFGYADVFISGGGDIDGKTKGKAQNLVFGGNVTYDGNAEQFITVRKDHYVTFDIHFSSVNNRSKFLTVGRGTSTGSGIAIHRLKVKGASGFDNVSNISCFDNDTDIKEGLVLTTITKIKISNSDLAATSEKIVVDLSENGSIFISENGALILPEASGVNTNNIKLPAGGSYSVIGGSGTLTLNSNAPTPGLANNGFVPANAKVLVGTALSGYITLDAEMALAGDLFATITYHATNHKGTVRLVGKNTFQTVAPGANLDGTNAAVYTANTAPKMAYLPNLIVDKCNFTTAFQSVGWNIYTDGFTSVQSGIYDVNAFTTVDGKDGNYVMGNFVTANDKYGSSFITSSISPATSGIYFAGIKNLGSKTQLISYKGSAPGFNTAVYIPNVITRQSNLKLSNTNLAIFNTAVTTSVPYALEMNHGNTTSNIDLGSHNLFITGGGNINVRQPFDNAALKLIDGVGPNQYASSNKSIIKNGTTVVRGKNTVLFVSVTPNSTTSQDANQDSPPAAVSRFTLNNLFLTAEGKVQMNNHILEVSGDLTHASFATAFVTTATTSGLVDMTGTSSKITFKTARLYIPSLKVNNSFITGVGAGSGADLVLGVGRGFNKFTSVLNISKSLNIANNFVTISGNGGRIAGTIDGGTKDLNNGAVRIESFVTAEADFKFTNAGVEVYEYAGTTPDFATAFTTGRINVAESTVTFGGHLYENTNSFATADQFILGDTEKGSVNFACPSGAVQFISSNGGASAIKTNVAINNEVRLGKAVGPNTFDNVMLYLGGTGKNGAGGKATLALKNSSTNKALLNLNFNSVTFMTAGGHLYDSDPVADYSNTSCSSSYDFASARSIIGFGSVSFTNGGTGFTTTSLETDFGIEGNVFSSAKAQINLNGKQLYVGGDYTNAAMITNTFIPANTTETTSTLVMNGANFQSVTLGQGSTLKQTDVPHVVFAGKGVTLGTNIKVDGNGGNALTLTTVTNLNGNFITIGSAGSTPSSIYAESDASLKGLPMTTVDGIYLTTATYQKSTFTVDQADVFIKDGQTLMMTAGGCPSPISLNIGGDLVAISDVATRAVTNSAGGASVKSGDTKEHGYVNFISTSDVNLKFHTIGGIAAVPALTFNIPFATAHILSAPSNFISVTSNADTTVLKFTKGNLHLNKTTLAISGTGKNSIDDETVNNAVFLTAPNAMPEGNMGKIALKGGITTFNVGDTGNTKGQSWKYNKGNMQGTFFPSILVEGGNGVLNGNIFTSALYLKNGDMHLSNNNIQFMTGGVLNEDLANEHLIMNTATPTYTGTPKGVVFATSVSLTSNLANDAGKNLGLVFKNSGAKVNVELRKDSKAAGKYANKIKVAIGRNYKVDLVSGTITNADVSMPFATVEVGVDNVTHESMSFISFTGAAQAAQTGVYSFLSRPHGKSSNILAFNTAFVTATSANFAGLTAGYITLGVRSVNIYHEKDGDENPYNQVAVTNGLFRLEYPKTGTPIGIAFKTVGPAITGRYANYGKDANFNGDFFISSGQADNGAAVTVTYSAATQEFFISAPALTTATFISVTPVDDTYLEGPEAVFASISRVTSGYVIGADYNAFLTINDNDVAGYEVAYSNTVYDVKSHTYKTYNNSGNNISVTASSFTTVRVAPDFVTVNEFLVGTDPAPDFATAFVTVAVKLRTQPMFGKKVSMSVVLNDASEIKVHSVLGFKTSSYSNTGGKITFDIPFTSTATASSNQWNKFVSVVLVGVDDNEVDNSYNNPIKQLMKLVEVKVNTNATATTSLDYVTPQTFVPTTPGSPTHTVLRPLGSVQINGGNRDNERAMNFIVDYLTITEGNASKQLKVSPSAILTHDVNLTLKLDNSKDANNCNYDITRAKLNNTNQVTLKFKANTRTPMFVTVSAVNNQIDDDTDRVLIKGTPVTSGQLFTPNLFGNLGGHIESSNQFFALISDNDVAGVDYNMNQFTRSGDIFITTVLESNQNKISHAVKLKSQPNDNEKVFITVKSYSSNDVKISTKDGAEKPFEILTFTKANWNKIQFITAHVKDDDLKEDAQELIRIELTATSSTNSCSPYATSPFDAKDFFIAIKDDASDDSQSGAGSAPAKVSGLVATPGSKQVVLNWAPNAESGITYQVFVYQLGQPKTLAGETTSTNFTVTNLTNGVDYVFEVVAVRKDSNGNIVAKGESSDPVTARPSIILGTEESNVTKLDVYPNPSNRIFNLRLANLNAKQLEVKVLSVTGQEIYTRAYSNTGGEFETSVDLGTMPIGMYVLIVNTENGSFRTKLVLTR